MYAIVRFMHVWSVMYVYDSCDCNVDCSTLRLMFLVSVIVVCLSTQIMGFVWDWQASVQLVFS